MTTNVLVKDYRTKELSICHKLKCSNALYLKPDEINL